MVEMGMEVVVVSGECGSGSGGGSGGGHVQ